MAVSMMNPKYLVDYSSAADSTQHHSILRSEVDRRLFRVTFIVDKITGNNFISSVPRSHDVSLRVELNSSGFRAPCF